MAKKEKKPVNDGINYELYGVDSTKAGKRKVKQKGVFFKMLNPKNLQTEIAKYGYSFSAKSFLLYILAAVVVATGVSVLFKLRFYLVALVFIFCLCCVPSLLLSSYKDMYEAKRFQDVSNYMETLLYSFRKNKKILSSLQDTLVAFEDDNGRMREVIEEAITYIRTANTNGNLYREALDIIEKEYDTTRLRNLHTFLIAVEANGGVVENPVDLLLEERASWDERTHTFQSERKTTKRNITISIVMSLALCYFLLAIINTEALQDLAIIQNMLVQISSTFVIIACAIMFTITTNKLSTSWLKRDARTTDYYVIKDYFATIDRDRKAEVKSSLIWTALMLPIILLGVILHNTVIIVIGVVCALFCLVSPMLSYNIARKNTIKEIEKAFPQWLMELALLLKYNNVQVAISKTINTAPVVLRPELIKLVQSLVNDSNSIVPYNNFLKDFDLPEIKSAMRMLYSITATGTGNIDEQITNLIKKQNTLMDKAEKISNEDSLAGLSTLTMLPMLFCVAKSLVDMVVLVFSLLTMVNMG